MKPIMLRLPVGGSSRTPLLESLRPRRPRPACVRNPCGDDEKADRMRRARTNRKRQVCVLHFGRAGASLHARSRRNAGRVAIGEGLLPPPSRQPIRVTRRSRSLRDSKRLEKAGDFRETGLFSGASTNLGRSAESRRNPGTFVDTTDFRERARIGLSRFSGRQEAVFPVSWPCENYLESRRAEAARPSQ